MDETTLHEINERMVDKVAVVFCIAMGNICSMTGIPIEIAKIFVAALALDTKCNPLDIDAVFEFAYQLTCAALKGEGTDFMSNHKATDEKIVQHLWPKERRNND